MRDNKYEKILSTATKLMSQKGVKETSLQEIADRVGVHKSTLYHYFKSKEELLLPIIEKSVDKVNLNLRKIIADKLLEPEEKLRDAIENHIALLMKNRDNVNIYLSDLRSLSEKNRRKYFKKRATYEKDFRKLIVEIKTKGYFTGLNKKIVTFGLIGMLNSVVRWYRIEGPVTIREISNIFYKMIVKK